MLTLSSPTLYSADIQMSSAIGYLTLELACLVSATNVALLPWILSFFCAATLCHSHPDLLRKANDHIN